MTREGKQKTLETRVAQRAHSLSQRSGPLWHSPVQKSSDSTTHRPRPGSKKANNRVRPRKLTSVILRPNACGGREPVLEAGEHRAVRHNTRRRSLNHYDSTEPSGRLIGHNRFPTLPSPLFPSGFKERFVVLCCIFFPFVGLCPPSLSPGGAPLGAQPIFSSVGGILPSSCISPNLYCLLLEIFCLLGICCLRFFLFSVATESEQATTRRLWRQQLLSSG